MKSSGFSRVSQLDMIRTSNKSTLIAAVVLSLLHPPVRVNSQSVQKKTIFTEVAENVGLTFRHYNGMTGKFYLPEIMGAGAALFDYDNDGDLDVFLVQGASGGRLFR